MYLARKRLLPKKVIAMIEFAQPVLNQSEIEQAIVLNRLSLSGLEALIGIHYASENIENSVLVVGHLENSTTAQQSIETFQKIGRREGEKWRELLKDRICKDWKYSERRKLGGFGDSRIFFSTLSGIIEPLIVGGNNEECSRSRMLLILVTVYLSRRSLSSLCEC